MKILVITVTLLGITHFTLADIGNHGGWSNDHLAPPDRTDEKTNSYQRLLVEKLGVTPFDCGRVVDSSSFGSEVLVSVYSRTQDRHRTYYVTSVSPEENLWQRTRSMRNTRNADSVDIHRIDAEIPEAVAVEIREVLLKMLHGARPSPPLGLEFTIQGYLDFSIQQSDTHPLYGQLRLPGPGLKTQTLAKISKSLWEYCQATPANRPSVAKKIDNQAKRLLAALKERQ